MLPKIKILELPEIPQEPVIESSIGNENLYLLGVSGVWYMYKIADNFPDAYV